MKIDSLQGGQKNKKGNQVGRNNSGKTETFVTKGCHETMVP